ncbi:PGF-CTERM sorting domain-containing protein [Haloplanus rubicundus]|uniref:PGF-CTERM sorting domain-containing protein n=1 Tax=Haloplanus rubicundus TaxID=1547898 RepID=A0A345EAJ1_9EURY|nr:PGF-CTERM sorting domain-containing protein [Haloplanus rubicundus]AXG09213.1 PGF-CTERM sorting domain-containing protein [Haloplanus rubicundus]
MTRNTRRAAAAALVVLAAGAVALPVVAVSEPRDAPEDTRPPVRVYVSETLDISSVQLSGDGTVGTEETTFTAVGGGESFTVDPTNASFDGVPVGSYYATDDSDVRADLTVVRPQVYSIVLRDERQEDVTGRSTDAANLDRLTIRARYSFADVDRLDVSVVDPSGAEVATARITENDQQITVDIPDPTPGIYRITASGSNIEAGNRTVTVRVRGQVATASATATATVTAAPTTTPTATPEPTPTATPTATPEPTPTATPEPTPTATPTAGTTADEGPGFGVVAALLALLAVALLGRRRR